MLVRMDRRRGLRIAHVVRRFDPLVGGTERYVSDLAVSQVGRGHRVVVVTLDRDVSGTFPGRLPPDGEVGGVRIVRLPGLGNQRVALCLRPDLAARHLRWADVVHLHDLRFLFGFAVAVTRLRGRRVVFHTHGLLFHTPWALGMKRLAMRLYYGPLLRAARATVVAGSPSDRTALLRDAPYLERQVKVVPHGLAMSDLLTLARSPEPGLVVAVGRVAASKGLGELLEALAHVERETWRLEIAGAEDRTERERLERLAERLGVADRVKFCGAFARHELGEYLSRAKLAVFPSRAEGFGLALVEALAAGAPVLANRIAPHAAVLGDRLRERLVDFSDPEAAGRAIAAALAASPSSDATLSGLERERAADHDITRLADEVDRLYGRLGLSVA